MCSCVSTRGRSREFSLDSARSTPPPRVRQIQPRLQKITVNSASRHVGKEDRLWSREGKLYSGTLTSAEPGRIWVEFHIGGGTLEMEFRPHEVRSLEVRL